MPYLSLALAVALVIGLASGVATDRPPTLHLSLILSASWTFAVVSYRTGWPRLQMVALASAVASAGVLLGNRAVDAALHTTLRAAVERAAGGFALDALDEGRLDEPVVIDGVLRTDAAVSEAGVSLAIDVTRIAIDGREEPVTGGIAVGVGGAPEPARLASWIAGTRIRAPVLLRRPARYLNAGLADQERSLARRGTTLVGAIKSGALVEVTAPGRWWERGSARVRAATRAAIDRHVGPRSESSAAIATAILIGDRSRLSIDIERRLQEAGTYHVIAISGGNIAILVATMLLSLGGIGVRGRLALIATIGGVVSYAVVAEGGASVARATLMAVIYLAVRAIDQRTAALNAIGLAGAAILLTTPLAIADVGFWLTFGASAAILVSTHWPATAGGWRRVVWSVVAATAAAELALAPVSALVFQRVTLAGLALNFVALPAMTVVQMSAMALVAIEWLSPGLAGWLGAVTHLGCVALVETARGVDYAPWTAWRVPSPSPWLVAAYYTMVLVALLAHGRADRWSRARHVRLVAAALFVWIVTAPGARVRATGDGRLHLTVIDVGQGDAALVTFPNGRTLVVDTGGASVGGGFDIGDRVVGPSLRARGLLGLDYLAVTHGDPDHLGGAVSLARDFAPREIWWGVPVPRHAPADALRAEADRHRAAWRTLQRGDRMAIGGVDLIVHHPPPPDWERQRVRNDDSLVLELRWRQVSMLLTGDIGKDVEQSLLPALDLAPVVVLKVAHHGSGTSSGAAFIEHLRPAIALIGVGRANPYGHPVPAVMERLHTAGARVCRTDRDGQIEVTTDGRTLSVETFTGTRYTK